MAKTSASGIWDQDPLGSGRSGSTSVKRTLSLKQVAKAKVVRDDWDDDDDDEEEQVGGEKVGDMDGDGKATTSGTRKDDGAALGPDPEGEREGKGRRGEDSQKVWEEANKRAPMPELIVAPASTSQGLPSPPPAALQPTLRILKRPSLNSGANNAGAVSLAPLSSSFPGPTSGSGSAPGSGAASPAPRGTLAEREAQYQEARSRIFGEKGCTSGNASPGSMSRTSSSAGRVVVVRDPLGPASGPELEPGMSGQDGTHDPSRPSKGFGERRRGRK